MGGRIVGGLMLQQDHPFVSIFLGLQLPPSMYSIAASTLPPLANNALTFCRASYPTPTRNIKKLVSN